MRQGFLCGGGCGKDLWRATGREQQAHHIIPHRMTQDTSLENLVVLCADCHVRYDNLSIMGNIYDGSEDGMKIEEVGLPNAVMDRVMPQIALNRRDPQLRKRVFVPPRDQW